MIVELKQDNTTLATYKEISFKVKENTQTQKPFISADFGVIVDFTLHELLNHKKLPIDYSQKFTIEYKQENIVFRLLDCIFNKGNTLEGNAWVKEVIDLSKYPKDCKPVLAEIHHQNSSKWHEVVYYDSDIKYCWCSYAGSNTFQKGENVVAWEYVENLKLNNNL